MPARSSAQRSSTSSTTQIALPSRAGSRQSAHGSVVSRLPQVVHCLSAAAAPASASASGSSSVSRFLRRARAARRAERGPRPGNLASKWISRSISSPRVKPDTWPSTRPGRSETFEEIAEEAGILKAARFEFLLGVRGGCNHEILDDLMLAGLHQGGIDAHLLDVAEAVHQHADQAAAGNAFDFHRR